LFAAKESGDHPSEDLAKSGYKPDMKYKCLISLVTHTEKKIMKNLGIFKTFFSHFWLLRNSKINSFSHS
jgi:hypothetical protein